MSKSVFFVRVLPALTLCLALSGCLKTRAQLREDGEVGPTPPERAQVVPVQPQGGYVIDELKSEMTRLQGRIEDLERSQRDSHAAASRTDNEEKKKLETRIIELEMAQANMLEEIKKLRDTAPPADPVEAFDKGKAAFEAGQHDAAIEQLSAYMRVPKAKRLEDATFLRGESYFATKQFKKAIVDYSKFPEKFTKSKRMPAALLKIGLSFESLGMKSDAQGFFAEVVEKYPKSPEAKKARAKIK